jgi:hypothetical protein
MDSWYELQSWTRHTVRSCCGRRGDRTLSHARINRPLRADQSPAEHISRNTISLMRRVILAQ